MCIWIFLRPQIVNLLFRFTAILIGGFEEEREKIRQKDQEKREAKRKENDDKQKADMVVNLMKGKLLRALFYGGRLIRC